MKENPVSWAKAPDHYPYKPQAEAVWQFIGRDAMHCVSKFELPWVLGTSFFIFHIIK